LALVIGTFAYAQNINNMGNGQTNSMKGQTTEQTQHNQNTKGSMNSKTGQKGSQGIHVGMHNKQTKNH
jgi:hypothetical protein